MQWQTDYKRNFKRQLGHKSDGLKCCGEKKIREERWGSWSGWEVASSSLWRVAVRQRGAGGGVWMSVGRASGGSARERPGMFWNSKASLAGGGDA